MKKMVLPILLLFSAISVHSQQFEKLIWATPEWQNYTEKNGNGIYNEIINSIYSKRGIKIVVEYVPWKRALYMVENKTADMTGTDENLGNFMYSSLPVIASREKAFYDSSRIKGIFSSKNLPGLKGIWMRGYLENSSLKGLEGYETDSRESAIKMLIAERVDYYLDNEFQMNQALNLISYDKNRYKTSLVAELNLYFIFSNSERGQYFKKIFDYEYAVLKNKGLLKKIYIKYNMMDSYPF